MIVKIRNIVKDKKVYIMFCFIFFLFMMALNLLHSAPWGDEWVEYYYSQTAIRTGDLYNRIIGTFQPPLYNFLMHFWLKMDQTILWFRLFNVFIGCVAGLFLLLASILSPLLDLIIFILALKLIAGLLEPLGNKQIANFVSSLAKSMVLLVALIIALSFAYFIMLGLVMCTANIF